MTHFEEQLTHLNTVRLPEEVKIRMRAELLAYAELHAPTSAPLSIPTPFFSGFTVRLYSGLSAAILLIVSIGGTAYAAENTLPGDVLYSVKVGITEPIQTALVPSERGKAAWNAILAERRLEEAAQLAAAHKLTPTAQTELAANFTAHVAASETHATSLQHSGDVNGSLSVQSDLEARLTAHEQILDVIAAHYTAASSTEIADTDTKGSLRTLLVTVREHQKAITSKRIALEDVISPSHDAEGADSTMGTTTLLARATPPQAPRLRFSNSANPAFRISNQTIVRTQEVNSILNSHAALLAKFLPVATSTIASSTPEASTTASTTSKNELP